MDPADPYLTRQLIAYIGNKRRLLPLIRSALLSACGEADGLTFLDAFAGSGGVSRLAKRMGFRVLCNDWEVFCRCINTAHVATDAREADPLFAAEGGLDAVLRDLQEPGDPVEPYLSRYHAPASDDPERADYRRERLFYTRANALVIDRIRERIEGRYPADGSERRDRQRALLIAPLLYQAATHTNTSGVFKAYHKGFGGHGRDALARILGPIRLERPILAESRHTCAVYCEDANALVRRHGADVAYLDPPYATHQYGSNYHLLTTIALWDRPPAPLDLGSDGRLRDKAGIRRDWVRTRSAYCSRQTAGDALQDLLHSLEARWILLSYSSEGLVPFERIVDLCHERGELRVHADLYTVYPGGRQSSGRRGRNVEAVLVVDTMRRPSAATRRRAQREIETRKAQLLLGRPHAWARFEAVFGAPDPDGLHHLVLAGGTLAVRRLPDGTLRAGSLASLRLEGLRRLVGALEVSVCRDAQEELAELVRTARDRGVDGPSATRRLARGLRKLAHRSNASLFQDWLRELRSLTLGPSAGYRALADELDRIEEIAARRLRG